MNEIVNTVREELESNSDEKTRISSQHFFKEEIKCYGIAAPTVSKIAKNFFKEINSMSKQEIFTLCEEFWLSGYIEESFIACNWSYSVHQDFENADLVLFEHWIDDFVNNWASCDTLCNHSVGKYLEMYPENCPRLLTWAKSSNRWMRRAASVSLIIPARNGKFLKYVFEIADILLLDKEDLVQKGYGWMLKAASQAHQQEVFNFVMKYKSTMPRTALRYAIEKMPKELKLEAMEK